MADDPKDQQRKSEEGAVDFTKMANAVMVPNNWENENSTYEGIHLRQQSIAATWNNEKTPISKIEAPSSIMQEPLSTTAKSLIDNATRVSTKKRYASVEHKWLTYCEEKQIPPFAPDTSTFLNFIAEAYDSKLKWATIRGFIPALKKYTWKTVNMQEVRSAIRGVYNLRPPVRKYSSIWDVNVVLSYMECMIIENFKDLSMKMVTLFMLLSGARVNMLTHLKMKNMHITDEEVTFTFDEVLKTSNQNNNSLPLTFRGYPARLGLCPVHCLWEYLEMRNPISDSDYLFVTTKKPHKAASKDSIARWIKDMLAISGIDSGKYSAHSCRSASTSKALFQGVSIKTIMKSASWKNEKTFRKHYLNEIEEHLEIENFGTAMLDQI